MIKKENKTIRITLDPETNELLNSLAKSYCKSKTEIIKVALRILAKSNKKPHYITIGFFEPETKQQPKKEQKPEVLEEQRRIAKTPWLDIEEEESSGGLPFKL